MFNFVLPSLIASIGWGVSPFFDEIVVKNTDVETALTYKGIFYGLIGLILFVFNAKHFLSIKDKYYNVKSLENRKFPLLLFSFIAVVFSYIVGNLAYYIALNNNNGPTMIVPLISYVFPLIIMTLISYFVTKDQINNKMLVGIIVTIFGIAFTLYNKDN